MQTADVVIVGGGCMGASVAWHLTQRGVTDVVLLEREPQLGLGSTGRNAGGVRHQFSDPANIALSRESIACIANFEQVVGTPVDFWPDGYLFLLSSEHSAAAFERNASAQREHGVDVRWIDPREAAKIASGISVDGVLGATFCPQDGIADPNGVTAGFAKAAQARGVRLLRDTEVTGILSEHNAIAGVQTTRGPIATRTVVNAAGPWAGLIGRMAGIDVPVVPERRHIFIAQPPFGSAWHSGENAEVPESRVLVIDFETSFYFHREGTGVLFGMADPDEQPGFDTSVRWDFLPSVIEVATRRLPALANAEVSRAWAGLYEMTPDHNPLIGESPVLRGFYLVTGFSGHGFQHSPAAGRIVADLIAERDPGLDLSSFAPGRFTGATLAGEGNVV